MHKPERVTILGAGRLGFMFSQLIAPYHPTSLYIHHAATFQKIRLLKRHPSFSEFFLQPQVKLSENLEEALEGAALVILSAPVAAFPQICRDLSLFLPEDVILCVGSKGIVETGTGLDIFASSFPRNAVASIVLNFPFRQQAVSQLMFAFARKQVPVPLKLLNTQYLLCSPAELLEWNVLVSKVYHFFAGFVSVLFGKAVLAYFFSPYLEWVTTFYRQEKLSLSSYFLSSGLGYLQTYLSDETNQDVELGRLLASGQPLSSALREIPAYSEMPHLLPFFLKRTPKNHFLELCLDILHEPNEAAATIRKEWLHL